MQNHTDSEDKEQLFLAIREALFIFSSFSTQISMDELIKLKFVLKHIVISICGSVVEKLL